MLPILSLRMLSRKPHLGQGRCPYAVRHDGGDTGFEPRVCAKPWGYGQEPVRHNRFLSLAELPVQPLSTFHLSEMPGSRF